MTTFELNGVTLTMELGDVETGEQGGWRNGTVTTPDGRTFAVGGGWIHSLESATLVNHCRGLQPDTHPDIQWPGAADAGDFAAYEGYELGDLDGLAAAVGLDIDRDTEAGDANWREMVETLRAASEQAAAE